MNTLPRSNSAATLIRHGVSGTVQFVMDKAVLYYISCCLLLLGSYLVMHSAWLPANFIDRYFQSYGIFLVYAVVLAGQCLLVLRRLDLLEDGLVLAGMVLLLVLDPSFFGDVFYTYKLSTGLWVNSIAAVLCLTLYAALISFARIKWGRRLFAMLILSAGLVFYAPAGLNSGWTGEAVRNYVYSLWWVPLLLCLLCPNRHELTSYATSTGALIDRKRGLGAGGQRLLSRFTIGSVLILGYSVLSHLFEAHYAYSIEVQSEFLAPTFLAVGLLCVKLPANPKSSRIAVWTCVLIALWCSANTASLAIRLPHGLTISSFHYGFAAVAFFLLYCWKVFGELSFLSGTVLVSVLAVSGSGLSSSISNISDLRPWPLLFAGCVLAAFSWIARKPFLGAAAGSCLLTSALSLIPIHGWDKFALFVQLSSICIGLVQWICFGHAAQRAFSRVSGVILLTVATMSWASHSPALWRIDYIVTLGGLYAAGLFLNNRSMKVQVLCGMAGALLIFARRYLKLMAVRFSVLLNPGIVFMVLAFLLLPLAYYVSTLKTRKRDSAPPVNETG